MFLVSTALCLFFTSTPLNPHAEVGAEQGHVGIRAGYRYVPNLFLLESEAVGQAVQNTYLGSPALTLHFDYFVVDEVFVGVDFEWGGERLELPIGQWIDTQTFNAALSLGYQFQLDTVYPYLLLGVDSIAAVVQDKIATGNIAIGVKGAFGAHGAAGLLFTGLISDLPQLVAVAEFRYTFAVFAQRGRPYNVLGASLVAGLQWRFDAAGVGNSSHPL
jgi:hypothetical protein